MNTSGSILSFSLSTRTSVVCKLDYDIDTNDTYTSFSRYIPGSGRNPTVAGSRRAGSGSGSVYRVTGEFYYAQSGENYDAMKTTYNESQVSAPRRQSSARGRTRGATVEQEFRIRTTAVESGKTEECYGKLKEQLPASQTQVTSQLLKQTQCWSRYQSDCSGNEPENEKGN
uniref:Uncharacterized protein n=1 Tax=Amblyomma aureolatum TaxID=187763 RepID=A0A1E1X1B3_9ACAR